MSGTLNSLSKIDVWLIDGNAIELSEKSAFARAGARFRLTGEMPIVQKGCAVIDQSSLEEISIPTEFFQAIEGNCVSPMA